MSAPAYSLWEGLFASWTQDSSFTRGLDRWSKCSCETAEGPITSLHGVSQRPSDQVQNSLLCYKMIHWCQGGTKRRLRQDYTIAKLVPFPQAADCICCQTVIAYSCKRYHTRCFLCQPRSPLGLLHRPDQIPPLQVYDAYFLTCDFSVTKTIQNIHWKNSELSFLVLKFLFLSFYHHNLV